MCLVKLAKESRVVCFFGEGLFFLDVFAASSPGGFAGDLDAPVLVGEGLPEARASAAAMPEGAGAGVMSSTALSAGGLAVGLVAGTNRAGPGRVSVSRLAARSENLCVRSSIIDFNAFTKQANTN